jgi:hypothetical protein
MAREVLIRVVRRDRRAGPNDDLWSAGQDLTQAEGRKFGIRSLVQNDVDRSGTARKFALVGRAIKIKINALLAPVADPHRYRRKADEQPGPVSLNLDNLRTGLCEKPSGQPPSQACRQIEHAYPPQ